MVSGAQDNDKIVQKAITMHAKILVFNHLMRSFFNLLSFQNMDVRA